MNLKIIPIRTGVGNAYLAIADKNFFLIDSGTSGHEKKIVKAITSKGLELNKLQFIFLTHTHYDHAGCAAFLKNLTGSKIIVQTSEAEKLANGYAGVPNGTNPFFKIISFFGKRINKPFHVFEQVEPDITFNDKFDLAEFGIQGQIIHTPGHTSGSSSLIIENVAFVGDTVFNIRSFIYPPFANNEDELLKSWGKLLDQDVKIYYPAHGKPVSKDKLLREYKKIDSKKG